MVDAVATRLGSPAGPQTGVDAKPVLHLVDRLAEVHVQAFEPEGPGAAHRRIDARSGGPAPPNAQHHESTHN